MVKREKWGRKQGWRSSSKVRSVEREWKPELCKKRKKGGKQDWLSWSKVRSVKKRHSADEDRTW
jgi:hypothetical protein